MSDQSLIVRSIAEYEAEARGEHRGAARSVPREPVGGTIHDLPFTVLQLSADGMRIRQDTPLLERETVQVALALPSPEPIMNLAAQVAWTSVGERCVSGLRVLDPAAMQNVLDRLTGAGLLAPEEGTRGSSSLGDLTDREVASILRAVRRGESPRSTIDAAKVETVVTWLRRTRESAAEAQSAL